MDVRKIVLLVGALLIAAVTAVMAKNMFTGASAPEATAAPVVLGPEVLVATRSLPVGTIIDAESLRFQPWPKELVEKAYYLKGEPGANMSELLGTVVRNEVSAGQPLTQGSMIKPGERGFLAAALGPGMRAVTVAVSTISGVAGFVFPGDRVDVILTQEVTGGEGQPLRAAETILRNVRVLAVDQRTTSTDEAGKPLVQTSATVTLEATPRIAEKIQVAQMVGGLTLALRSIADTTAELERAVASGEVQVPNTDDPVAERRMLLEIATKPMDTGGSVSVGGDVSRFQRRSVPRQAPAPAQGNSDPSNGMNGMIAALATANRAPAPATGEAPRPTGPTVRVTRGNTITVVPVGAK
jgi:pilus assembly protein CpaB